MSVRKIPATNVNATNSSLGWWEMAIGIGLLFRPLIRFFRERERRLWEGR